jgi:hypothetical protein
LESVHAGMACLWVAVVSSVGKDVGDIVGVVGVPNGAVGGSRESERSSLEVPLVGEVRRDVGGIVGVVVVCRFSVFGFFLKECWSVVARGRSRCRGFIGVGACRYGMFVGRSSVFSG